MSLTPSRRSAIDDLRDLTQAEHLVLFGFRATALGHGDCPTLARTFRGLLGREADAALCHLLVLVRMIGAAGARKVRLHPPGCCGISADERLILGLLAAAQASNGGTAGRTADDMLRAGMGDLLAGPPCEAALAAARTFAASLTLGGLALREGTPRPVAGSIPPPSPTIH